jgi:hypothetical protein
MYMPHAPIVISRSVIPSRAAAYGESMPALGEAGEPGLLIVSSSRYPSMLPAGMKSERFGIASSEPSSQ